MYKYKYMYAQTRTSGVRQEVTGDGHVVQVDCQGAVELALPVQPVQYTVTRGNHKLVPQAEQARVIERQRCHNEHTPQNLYLLTLYV